MIKYEDIKKEIEDKKYTLLTQKNDFINTLKTKLLLKCPNNHIYNTTWNRWKIAKSRCKKCYTNEQILKYEDVKKEIEDKNFQLLSNKNEYKGASKKIKIKCNKGHISNILIYNWRRGKIKCKECSYDIKRKNIEIINEYCNKYGYFLKTKDYYNAIQTLKFLCPNNHIYKCSWSNFLRGSRCVKCSEIQISKSEKEIVFFIKSIINKKIIENDRTQIVNPLTGHMLELDIWIPSLNKAIEFNGDYWHANPKIYDDNSIFIFNGKYINAKKIWEKDFLKISLCKIKNIDLLVIWEKDWIENKKYCEMEILNFINDDI